MLNYLIFIFRAFACGLGLNAFCFSLALTDGIFETGAYRVSSKSQKPTVLGQGGPSSQGPLNIWTEHSNCQIHSRGGLKNPYSFTDTQYFLDFF